MIFVVIPLLKDKSAFSASIVISKVLVLVSADGEIKEMIQVEIIAVKAIFLLILPEGNGLSGRFILSISRSK